jgi:hypothetical protein
MRTIRNLFLLGLFGLTGMLGIFVAGCDETTNILEPDEMAPPLGLTSVTGDEKVTLHWQASNYDEDRETFEVYRASGNLAGQAPSEIPAAFGSTPVATLSSTQAAGNFQVEVTGLTNGTTYSFLVVAAKNEGDDISRPSNIVSDTPRIESGVVSLINGGSSRYLDVAGDPPVPSGSATNADILSESFNAGAGDRHGMVGVNGARIQDLGWVSSWDEVDEAPLGGGSYPDAAYSVQVLPGHVYAVFTGDNHYAKVYVSSIHTSDFGYDLRVAYQPAAGNNELAPRTRGD